MEAHLVEILLESGSFKVRCSCVSVSDIGLFNKECLFLGGALNDGGLDLGSDHSLFEVFVLHHRIDLFVN